MAVCVQYMYHHCDIGGYSDRGGHAQCLWLLCHMICHMMYVCVGETHVHVHPLCQSYYGCSNGTVTKHGSTGHPSIKEASDQGVHL